MSFGFGFALPAYPLRGGTGNNPFNQLGPTLDLSFTGVVTDLTDPNGYTLNTDFIIPQYQIAAQYVVWETGVGLVDKTFSQIITFTRASTATYFDSAGVLQSAAIDAPRLDYNPSTLAAQGLLIEEARTNSIRNNTMQGAVAGTPGTLPTTWTTQLNGLTQTVVGTGTVNGISYIDIRFNGTTTSLGTLQVKPDGNASGTITATASQAWAMSSWVSIVGGSTANTTAQRLICNEYSAGPTYLRTGVAVTNILAGGATFTRVSGSFTTGASTTILEPIIGLDHASGVAIDITLRIGLPQLELGAFATSVISTTTTALTRSADVASVNTLSPWFNAAAGTLFAEYAVSGFASAGAFPSTAALSDGTTNNRVSLASTNTGASLYSYGEVQAGGAPQAGFYGASGAAFGVGAARKAAISYAANDFAFTTQGLAVQTDTSGTVPTINALYLGVAATGSTQFQNGYLRRITYYPRRLSNAELQTITT